MTTQRSQTSPLPDNVRAAMLQQCADCPTRNEVQQATGALRFAKWIAPVIYLLSAGAFAGYVKYTVTTELDRRFPMARPIVTTPIGFPFSTANAAGTPRKP